jgi:hypothetical protein
MHPVDERILELPGIDHADDAVKGVMGGYSYWKERWANVPA